MPVAFCACLSQMTAPATNGKGVLTLPDPPPGDASVWHQARPAGSGSRLVLSSPQLGQHLHHASSPVSFTAVAPHEVISSSASIACLEHVGVHVIMWLRSL